MQINVPNDLVYFGSQCIICYAVSGEKVFSLARSEECFLETLFHSDKMMDVFLIFEPICTAMHG